MDAKTNHIKQLAILYETYTGQEVAQAVGVSVRQIQNYLKKENAPTPTRETINNIHEAFAKHEARLPIFKEDSEDYKTRYITSLEKQVKYLEDQLSLVSGQVRHYLLLTNALVETNQDALASLLVKQKVGTEREVYDDLSRQNAENYTKKKKEVGIV